ncbi:penicillin-binding protein, peptidoglycan glycosyltransferase [Bacillus methanolicus PB1]|uniref:Penicillin-binding protein, peptidoglycan glycosyltransferase n=1 Tax=Bacillus methanolicus PB1 TaxID=997296 RepID=I3E667_BACMT|nr:PBP1A family penicillin-binding protein [Bacillus methanolicus]EIJ81988.1 penicillin-binding protein, peptidoglycan glycosyltransferase [Bacillus methanolicus PB1]
MNKLHSVLTSFSKLWKQKHMTQIVVLSLLILFLGVLSFFYYFSKNADIRSLKAGLAQSTIIYDQSGKVASKISANKNEAVPIELVPDHMKNAVVAIEDHRFYEHNGIDLVGIVRAFFRNFKAGEVVEGGSTITQQLTKNALLSPEKTYKRKIEELFLAREIEKEYTKKEILEIYLNEIYFGEGAWGIKRAALKYFGKEVKDLTLSESAMLAGLIKAPSAINPYADYEKAIERRNIVLEQMRKYEFISDAEYDKAVNEKLVLDDKGGDPFRGKYPYYVDHVIEEAIQEYGLTQDELLTGGYHIYTELDPDMQSAIEAVYENDELFPEGTADQIVQSGAVLLDPQTDAVRALVGGRGEHVFRGYNRATQLRAQPGSTMKPLAVYTPALEEGWKPEDELKDEKMSFGDYEPSNYNHQYKGMVPMYDAVKDSLNVPAVWLLNEIGIEKGINAVERFGIPLDNGDRNLGLALGGLEKGVSPLMMAEAFSVFPNEGERIEAHAITKIVDADGITVAKWKKKKTKVTTKSVADMMTTMLLGVVEHGTGKGAQIPGREVAGKTGSTQVPINGINGVKDQWFVGYTPELVGAVWVGYDKTDKNHYLTTTSSEGAALVFKEIMEDALKDKETSSFHVPHISSYMEKRKQEEWKWKAHELEESIKKETKKWNEKVEKEKEKWEKKWKRKGKNDD